jgi:uncharacterized protein (TIGR03118 family)
MNTISLELNPRGRLLGTRAASPIVLCIAFVSSGCGGSESHGGVAEPFGRFAVTKFESGFSSPTTTNPHGPIWLAMKGADSRAGRVTDVIARPVSGFAIPKSVRGTYIFTREDGTISVGNTSATATPVFRSEGANYKGLTIGTSGGAKLLFVTNFATGTVDVFDATLTFKSSFCDPTMPVGYAPFGIREIDGLLYVTYAKQDAAKRDATPGEAHGYVDVFKPNGAMVQRLVSESVLNSPRAIAKAPAGFGRANSALLIGNYGDGKINAFDINTGASLGVLNDSTDQPIAVEGLWDLKFAEPSLYFAVDPANGADSSFGKLEVAR